jgi:hypothetical protein
MRLTDGKITNNKLLKKKTLILADSNREPNFTIMQGINSNDMMSSVIEKGLKRSIEQSEFMAASLMDQPDSFQKRQRMMELLIRQIRIGGLEAFFRNVRMLYEARDETRKNMQKTIRSY